MNLSILSLWGVWDSIYQNCTRLQYVEKGKNIFRFVLLQYSGESLMTKNNTVIHTGDWIVKLHIHNYFFAKLCHGIKNETRIVLILRKYTLESLPELAKLIASHPKADEIKGIVGTTMIHKGVEPLGFSVADVPENLFFRYKKWYLLLMRSLIHPDGKRMKKGLDNLRLKRVYMSKEELFEHYLDKKTNNQRSEMGEPTV